MRGLRPILILLSVVTLAGCDGSKSPDQAAGSAQGPDQSQDQAQDQSDARLAAAPAAFGECHACHSLDPGQHGIGPSLFGVYGTKAGEVVGYSFSPQMKASGLTWDDATLDKWLAGPMQLVPGTKMTYAGQSDPAKRKELIAFLKTLK